MPEKKVLAAMSGGVDSSVAALLLRQSGYDVIGAMMKLYENEDIGEDIMSSCCSLADRGEAEAAAELIGIPFFVFNYSDEFRTHVMDAFAEEYSHGRTPNPCVECNRHLKFGALFKRADKMKRDYIATGHYARVEKDSTGIFRLMRGLDSTKDQSYALYFLTQTDLQRVIFPLGNYLKSEVRAIAEANGLKNAKKPDSQDICFVPNGDYASFLNTHFGAEAAPGYFLDAGGKILGKHTGARNYTIGQRRGLGISSSDRLYVTAIDAENNTVTLGSAGDLYADRLKASGVSFTAPDYAAQSSMKCRAKIRYAAPPVPAVLYKTSDNEIDVTFEEPCRAITPGQSVVLYDGDTVIGGGIILLD